MPSSAHTVSYSGPSCVYPQSPAAQSSMHNYYYKNPTPPGAIVPPTVQTNPRARLVLQETNSPATGRYNSPVSSRLNDVSRQAHSRTTSTHSTTQQQNGQTDPMSVSVHTPRNPHFWSTNTPTTTHGVSNPSAATPLSSYAHNTVPTSGNTYGYSNTSNSHYCGVNAATYDINDKQNGSCKSTSNGSSKVSGLAGNRPLWKERPHVGRYSLIRTIGKGNFAKVKLAQHLTTGMQVAVKVIDKTLLNHSSMQKLFREVRVLKTLNHPNIIKLLEVIESERHLYLVTEYASGGEVFDYLVSHGKMKESVARAKFRQIVSAVQYCHQKMVVHRDLKAENLLLDEELNVKIADFGFSNYFSPSQKLDTFCGSPPYAAPELFLGRKYDGPEVDVWSLGVILYTLVSGTLPFDGKNLKELRERVLRGTYRVPFYMTHECEMLLKKMLVLNPAKRLPLLEVMRDPWLNIGFDSILRPFSEPPTDYCDPARIEMMIRLGFQRHEIQDALTQQRFNNITATYILLSRYNPQIHGRLPGICSQSATRQSAKSDTARPRPDHDFVVNGTTQVLLTQLPDTATTTTTTNTVSSTQPHTRPASAAPATTSLPVYGTPKLGGSQRTPDESPGTKNEYSAATAAVGTVTSSADQTRRDCILQTSAAAPCTSVGSVSSTVTASSSSTESDALPSAKSEAERPSEHVPPPVSRPQGIRRSATTVEPRMLSTPYTKTTVDPAVSLTPRVSLATATATILDPMVKPDLTPSVHYGHPAAPPAVTTARLTLTSGFAQPSAVRLSSASSPPHPSRSRSSSRCTATSAAPLALLEDEGVGPTTTAAALKRIEFHEMDRSTTRPCNGAARLPSPSSSRTSSTSSEADSDSDVYDRECGSGSSDSSTRTGQARQATLVVADATATTTNTSAPSQHMESRITSVVVAAAPGIHTSVNGGGVANSHTVAEPDRLPETMSSRTPGEQPHFARLPSVRRRWTNNRSSTEPIPNPAPVTVVSARDQRVPPDGSTAESQTGGRASLPTAQHTSSTAIKHGPRTTAVGAVDGDASSKAASATDRNGTVAQRGLLLRGPPNVADILNEANPFRLTTDTGRAPVTSVSNTGAAVNPPTKVSNTRAFSPPPSTPGLSLPATRRPIAPPPLATTTFTNYPSRTSYAYHSLRLPSSTTTATVAVGRAGRPIEPSRTSQWLRDDADDDGGMATPTPNTSSHAREPYSIPFGRNLPERSTIQHVPTGRARERLESAPRLVRHPGTHSIANQSGAIRPHSPTYLTDEMTTPRPASPDDDLSISSANSSVSTLSQLAGTGARKDLTEDAARPGAIAMRQSNTLDSPVLRSNRQQSARAFGNRDGQTNGGLNNFFRSITTRISRSKLFRRSAILQANEPSSLNQQPPDQRVRLDPMTAPTMDLDKVILTHGSPSPNGTTTTAGSHTARLPRSRSGVTPHRPVSQVTGRQQPELSDRITDGQSTFRRTPSRKESSGPLVDSRELEGTLDHKWSKRSTSSHDTRSSRRSISSKRSAGSGVQPDPDGSPTPGMEQQQQRSDDPTEEPATLSRSKTRRSMRYVLKPFAKWPLDEVMIEVKRTLTNHGVDFELIGERKLQCVYGDPSCVGHHQSGARETGRGNASRPASLLDGVVHWEMEVGKLAGVGVNGIRFKRINGSMATFKQIAKKLAADLRF